jgi:hypothetical protein
LFWVAAVVLAAFTIWWSPPAWVWLLRVATVLAGIGTAVWLILRERWRAQRGLPADRDATAFDLWTIAHTLAGMVMGAWGIPCPLLVIYTVGWEAFEWRVPGFGDAEIVANRIVDVGVAWVAWLVTAAWLSAATGVRIPWL